MARRIGQGSNPGSGGGAPSGSAGGDLTGTYPNPTIGAGKVTSAAILDGTIAGGDLNSAIVLPSGATVTTQAAGDSSTKPASTAFVAANAAPLQQTVGGPARYIRRTGDSGTISSNNTPAADDTLLWTMVANEVDFFEMFLLFTAADSGGLATTADIKLALTGPVSATATWGWVGSSLTSQAGYGSVGTGSSPGLMSAISGTLTAGTVAGTLGLTVGGIVVNSTNAGNVTLLWSQNTSNAATLKILTNSLIRVVRLA